MSSNKQQDGITVKKIWERIYTEWPDLVKIRLDRAAWMVEGQHASQARAIEVGYGSHTVRVRVFDGHQMVGFVDIDTRATEAAVQERMDEVEMLVERARLRAELRDPAEGRGIIPPYVGEQVDG